MLVLLLAYKYGDITGKLGNVYNFSLLNKLMTNPNLLDECLHRALVYEGSKTKFTVTTSSQYSY